MSKLREVACSAQRAVGSVSVALSGSASGRLGLHRLRLSMRSRALIVAGPILTVARLVEPTAHTTSSRANWSHASSSHASFSAVQAVTMALIVRARPRSRLHVHASIGHG